jgi:hypothetical protein
MRIALGAQLIHRRRSGGWWRMAPVGAGDQHGHRALTEAEGELRYGSGPVDRAAGLIPLLRAP